MRGHLRIYLRRFVSGLIGGIYRSNEPGSGGYELKELKEFGIGDDVSAVNFLTSIKRGKVFLVLREPERAVRILFLVDLSRSGKFGSSGASALDLQASLLSILSEAAAEGTNQIGLLAFTSRVENFWKPRVGLGRFLSRVQKAAGFTDLKSGTDLKVAFDFAVKLKSRPDLTIICSAFLAEENYNESLARLKSKSDVVALLLTDPKERELEAPWGGHISIRDLESRAFKNVGGVKVDIWPGEETLKRSAVDYEVFSTSDDSEAQKARLQRLFEKRRIAGVRLK